MTFPFLKKLFDRIMQVTPNADLWGQELMTKHAQIIDIAKGRMEGNVVSPPTNENYLILGLNRVLQHLWRQYILNLVGILRRRL